MTEDRQTGRIVAVHQPNFFPWLGYFDKIAKSDIFVSLDDVQLPRGSSSWVNRVKLMIAGEPRWATAPLQRIRSDQRIDETLFDPAPWRRKLAASLRSSYRRAPFFDEAIALVEPLLLDPEPNVARYNFSATVTIAGALGIDTGKIRRSSEVEYEGSATDRLIALTLRFGGTAYMSGSGADGYQEPDKFAEAGLELIERDYRHPHYPQPLQSGEFVAGLSTIDALMNVGAAGTASLLGIGSDR